MIDHVRTLLLNGTVERELAATAGYVDPEFTPVRLPQWLESLRQTLTGHADGPAHVVERVHQLIRLVYSTALRPLLYEDDIRITLDTAQQFASDEPASNGILDMLDALGQQLDDKTSAKLFGNPLSERYALLHALWAHSPHVAYRVCGVLFAIAWRIEEYRKKQA
jgi:hypothetical protein